MSKPITCDAAAEMAGHLRSQYPIDRAEVADFIDAFSAQCLQPNPQGFTDQLKTICEQRCADAAGEPPCWRLPEMIEPCEHITPCAECLSDTAKADNG